MWIRSAQNDEVANGGPLNLEEASVPFEAMIYFEGDQRLMRYPVSGAPSSFTADRPQPGQSWVGVSLAVQSNGHILATDSDVLGYCD